MNLDSYFVALCQTIICRSFAHAVADTETSIPAPHEHQPSLLPLPEETRARIASRSPAFLN